MHLKTPSAALLPVLCTSSVGGSALRAMRNSLSTKAAAVGTGFGLATHDPTVWASGVGLPCVAAVPAIFVGDAGALVAVLADDPPPQAVMIAESVAALVPTATRRRKRRRSSPFP